MEGARIALPAGEALCVHGRLCGIIHRCQDGHPRLQAPQLPDCIDEIDTDLDVPSVLHQCTDARPALTS